MARRNIGGNKKENYEWVLRQSAADNNWNSVCYSEPLDLYCAVASSGTGNRVMTSKDGKAWETQASSADLVWTSVCWGNGLFVAVGGQIGANYGIMTSPDGKVWTNRTATGLAAGLTCVCYGGGLYVAVGYGQYCYTSTNGTLWSRRTMAKNNHKYSVCYSEDLGFYVATGEGGIGYPIEISTDGTTWSAISVPMPYVTWQSVCYSKDLGLYTAVSNVNGGGEVLKSPDANNWTRHGGLTYTYIRSVCSGRKLLMAISRYGTMCSKDSDTWIPVPVPTENNWNSVCYGKDKFVAVSSTGTGNRVMTMDWK